MHIKLVTRCRRLHLCILLLAVPLDLTAQAWQPGPCDPSWANRQDAYDAAVRAARPGSTVYVPVPFPQKFSDVVTDFKFRYSFLHPDEQHVLDFERTLFSNLASDNLTYRLERVENWSPTRCLTDQRNEFYLLLIMTDSTTHQDSGRAVLQTSGQLASLRSRPSRRPFPPPITDLARLVAEEYGLEAEGGQLVQVWGSVQCSNFDPCFAFESGGKNYLLTSDGLFAFDLSKKLPQENALRLGSFFNFGTVQALLNKDQRLVTLAREGWAIAERVPRRAR